MRAYGRVLHSRAAVLDLKRGVITGEAPRDELNHVCTVGRMTRVLDIG
jgi:hypothetical protein